MAYTTATVVGREFTGGGGLKVTLAYSGDGVGAHQEVYTVNLNSPLPATWLRGHAMKVLDVLNRATVAEADAVPGAVLDTTTPLRPPPPPAQEPPPALAVYQAWLVEYRLVAQLMLGRVLMNEPAVVALADRVRAGFRPEYLPSLASEDILRVP